jgi:hypothetical protein
MNEKYREEWLSMLETTNIDKRHYEKVLSYIDMYLVGENLYGHIDMKILPLSFLIFSMIDLDKVDFVAYPMETDNYMVEMSEGYTDTNIVNEISQCINNKVNDGYRVRIYRIIQQILKMGDKTQVHFRLNFYK